MPGMPEFILPELLVVFLVKSMLILMVGLTLTWFMRRSSAAARHLCLAVAAIALFVLPLGGLLLPAWHLGLLPDTTSLEQISPVGGESLALSGSEPATSSGDLSTGNHGTTPTHTSAVTRSLRWLMLGWGVGAVLLLAGLAAGKIYGLWSVRKANIVKDESITKAVAEISERVSLDRSVEVRESARVKVPSVVGVFRPRLLLPRQASAWPEARLRAILHHELAHIRRHDILVQLVAQITCCLYWLNPLVWILERRLFIERERACDNVALHREIKASDYAEHLMEVLEEMGDMKQTIWVTAAMAEGTDFKDRILSVLNPVAPRTSPHRVQALGVVALALLLVLPFSALSPWSKAAAARMDYGTMGADPLTDGSWNSDPESSQESSRESSRESNRDDIRESHRESDRIKDREQDRESTQDESREHDSEHAVTFTFLLEMLRDPVAEIRKDAALELGELGDSRAVIPLIEALQDESAHVREHVATALGHLRAERAVLPLCDVLLNDRFVSVREHAATALGYIGDDQATQALMKSVRTDPDDKVREHAAKALRKLR